MAAAGAILVAHAASCSRARSARASRPPELDEAAERFIRSQGATPAFKGYRGFPGSICASPNSMVVHGIPGPVQARARRHHLGRRRRRRSTAGSPTRRARSRSARSRRSPQKLLDVDARRRCSTPSSSAAPGNRLGDVSHAVQARVEAEGLSRRALARRPRHRPRHARGPADPQLRPAGPRARCSRRAWCSRSSRWSPPAATRCGWATTAGRSSPRTARWPPTSSSRSRSPPTARGS